MRFRKRKPAPTAPVVVEPVNTLEPIETLRLFTLADLEAEQERTRRQALNGVIRYREAFAAGLAAGKRRPSPIPPSPSWKQKYEIHAAEKAAWTQGWNDAVKTLQGGGNAGQ